MTVAEPGDAGRSLSYRIIKYHVIQFCVLYHEFCKCQTKNIFNFSENAKRLCERRLGDGLLADTRLTGSRLA